MPGRLLSPRTTTTTRLLGCVLLVGHYYYAMVDAQLEVLGLGFPRTGTDSLKEALDLLGYKTYHMKVAVESRDDLRFWTDVFENQVSPLSSFNKDDALNKNETLDRSESGRVVVKDAATPDYATFFDARNFTAAADLPFLGDWRRLLRLYPEAKVVLTVRPAESWWRSASSTVFPFFDTFPFNVIRRVDPFLAAFYAMSSHAWAAIMPFLRDDDDDDENEGARGGARNDPRARKNYASTPRYCDVRKDREKSLDAFADHNAEVKSAVAPDRLLVFDVKDGWAPLCAFLGVRPVPTVPFPHVNSGFAFNLKRRLATLVLLAASVGLAYLVWRLVLRRLLLLALTSSRNGSHKHTNPSKKSA